MNEITQSYFEDEEEVFKVIDSKNIQNYLAFHENLSDDELNIFDMTSLGTLMLLGQTICGKSVSDNYCDDDDDEKLRRLSLAYEQMHNVPKILIEEFSYKVKILDLSHNEIDNLDFLKEFTQLTTLICDHNNITSTTRLPYMPKMELLWLNHCKITSLYPWAKNLQLSCPNLKYLSIMGNSVAPSYLNGGNFYDYLQYRLFIISLFPKLIHLDDKIVTEDQRQEAERMYHRPLVERLALKTNLDFANYLHSVSSTVSNLLTPRTDFVVPQKSVII